MPEGAFKDQIWSYSYHAGMVVGHIFIGKEFLAGEIALLCILVDVVGDGERIYGNGVNIAARVESLAHGGETSIGVYSVDIEC